MGWIEGGGVGLVSGFSLEVSGFSRGHTLLVELLLVFYGTWGGGGCIVGLVGHDSRLWPSGLRRLKG